MGTHPADAQEYCAIGIVTAVHPDTWEVDVAFPHGNRGELKRVKVASHFLPEVHLDAQGAHPERQSKVVVFWSEGYQSSPRCIPLHNALIPAAEKSRYVFWLELLECRVTIDRDNVVEVRNLSDAGVIRSKTPKTEVVQDNGDGSIAATCTGDARLDAGGDVDATAGGNISAEAGGDVDVDAGGGLSAKAGGQASVEAPAIALTGNVTITGNVTVTGNVTATGTIIDAAGNTNHHSH